MAQTVTSEAPWRGYAQALTASAQAFCDEMAAIDRRLRRTGATIPPADAKAEVVTVFWRMVEVMHAAGTSGHPNDDTIAHCRGIVGEWLFRSRLWNRAQHKPHGYAGDYVMVEWMYDLESEACADPFQPAVVNCLDELFKTVHSVVSVWERRRWFARLLHRERERRGGTLRVLDVAAGGGRYLRDFLESVPAATGVSITVVDQDAAAVAFCRERSLAPWRDQVSFLCAPIRSLPALLQAQRFDVVISAGLFDYLDEQAARDLLDHLTGALQPGGVLALSNFHSADPSRFVKEFLVDWQLLYRNEDQCARLFPPSLAVETSRSDNEALVYAVGNRPALGG